MAASVIAAVSPTVRMMWFLLQPMGEPFEIIASQTMAWIGEGKLKPANHSLSMFSRQGRNGSSENCNNSVYSFNTFIVRWG
jgi:hypothetical protein